MSTKDQAIAWYLQTPKKTRVTQINMDGEDGWMPLFPRPAPDCRTCNNFDTDKIDGAGFWYCEKAEAKTNRCINGDKYQPAPKVVLWRTE